MSRFWLNYRRRKRGRLLGAVILDSPSLVQARMSAAALRIDRGMPFADGRALGKAAVELVPAAALGRMLTPQEARALQESLATAAPERIAICSAQAPQP